MNRYERHELDDDDDSVHFRWRENMDCGVWERIKYGSARRDQRKHCQPEYILKERLSQFTLLAMYSILMTQSF